MLVFLAFYRYNDKHDLAKGAKAMRQKPFPVIDMVETGKNIVRLREDRGMTVRDVQAYFGFEEPQAIYKWQSGKSLPTVDNLYALGVLLEVPMEEILVRANAKPNMIVLEQQDEPCCSNHFWIRLLWSLLWLYHSAFRADCH